jgi:hypothetical protein
MPFWTAFLRGCASRFGIRVSATIATEIQKKLLAGGYDSDQSEDGV